MKSKYCYKCNKRISLLKRMFGITMCSDCDLKGLEKIRRLKSLEVDELKNSLRKMNLEIDIENFKRQFFPCDIKKNPLVYLAYKRFGNKSINELNLKEIMCLGFNSDYLCRGDIEEIDEEIDRAIVIKSIKQLDSNLENKNE
jgi:hypothetical protein